MTKGPNRFMHQGDGTTVLYLKRKGTTLECHIDTADYDRVKTYRWSVSKSKKTFYATTNCQKPNGAWTMMLMHNLLTGIKPTDHKNGNGLCNLRSNLRTATNQQNAANRRKHDYTTSSQYIGVTWNHIKQRFRAVIGVDYKSIHLGYFVSEIDAAKKRDEAALKYFGQFAVLNFPADVRDLAA